MTDRELLELAEIGRRAVLEHAAWVVRNKARRELQKWMRRYQDETGEWFHRDEAEAEDIETFDALKKPAEEAQKKLTSARAATRRAIVRAAAAIGKAMA